jgi:CheY-like chemotaxis protein
VLHDVILTVLGIEDETSRVEDPEQKEPTATGKEFRSLRILVAEDNVINQKVALRILDKLGHRADVVGNGKEALEILRTRPYDLIFMDCNMPVMDGFAATAAIRSDEGKERHTVIIAMTANALLGDRERVLDAGMDDYIAKPVTQKELSTMIERWTSDIPPSASQHPETQAQAHSPAPPKSVLDADRLKELAELGDEDDKDWLRSLIERYLEDTVQRLDELQKALEQKDAKKLGEVAHALKGSSHNMGVLNLVEPSQALQKIGEGGTTEGAAEYVGRLVRGYGEARAEFEMVYLMQEGSR